MTSSTDSFRGVLDDVYNHFKTYILTSDDSDLRILALWTAHTHLIEVLYTSPRLQMDSMLPGSGKTTTLEHLHHLTRKSVQAASISSPALLARLLDKEPIAILIDEVGRNLDPKEPGTKELLAILNSGYKRGSTRPVLLPDKEEGWKTAEMSTYGPVAMAGIAPNLEPDTRSRSIRILLMPDLTGAVAETDWEELDGPTKELQGRLAAASAEVSEMVRRSRPALPAKCVGRTKEKWAPLARIAEVAGGEWPASVNELIERDIEEMEAEQETGLASLRPEIQLLKDLHRVWPQETRFRRTEDLVSSLIGVNPDYWGEFSAYGRALTVQRFGRLVITGSKVRARKVNGERGYTRASFAPIWKRLGYVDASPTDTLITDRPDRPSRPDRPPLTANTDGSDGSGGSGGSHRGSGGAGDAPIQASAKCDACGDSKGPGLDGDPCKMSGCTGTYTRRWQA